MIENLSHLTLQQYWWILISILGGLLVFLMFVQGGQTLIKTIGKTETERTILINAIGRKWDLTFTTLVTFGGAFFASFPLFYSTSFGGAYWVWLLILFGFIFQAVSYEFRKKEGNFLGTKTYDFLLLMNGLLATILIGAAVSTFFTGSEFFINENYIQDGDIKSKWMHPGRGLEAALNIQNLALGLSVFFLARILALLYFIKTTKVESIHTRSRKHLGINSVLFLLFFLPFLVMLFLKEGFAVNPDTSEVFMESNKYLNNLIEMPVVLVLFLLGVLGVLVGMFNGIFKKKENGIWFAGIGTIVTVIALFLIAGFNNTAFYPSTFDLQSSLTITNASSSKFTLTTMTYVSFLIPFVIAYIWWAWRSMNKEKITTEEIENDQKADEHVY